MHKLVVKSIQILLILTCCARSFANTLPSSIIWDGYIKVEDVDNIHGGNKTGSVLNATAGLTATYNQKFKIGILGDTHTKSQSLYTNSIQNTSSLNVQREIRLSDLSYTHTWNQGITSRIGVMDLEDYFDITESANYLLNSAFLNAMALDQNTQLASFPYQGIGAMLEVTNQKDYALIGLYQGNPQHLHTVFYKGYMVIGEIGTNIPISYKALQNLSLKTGAWLYQASTIPDITNSCGAYLISQLSWQWHKHTMAAFLQIAYSNEAPKYIPYSLTLGAQSNNIFLHNDNDWLSFGIGKVWIYNLPSEVVYELSYTIKFCNKFYVTPDLQYFIKPSGINPNATVLSLRLSYIF